MTDSNEENGEESIDKQVHAGVSITGKMKMGSGTRDQATLKIKGKGEDAEEAVEEFEEALNAADDGIWGHRLLELNPERWDEEEEEEEDA